MNTNNAFFELITSSDLSIEYVNDSYDDEGFLMPDFPIGFFDDNSDGNSTVESDIDPHVISEDELLLEVMITSSESEYDSGDEPDYDSVVEFESVVYDYSDDEYETETNTISSMLAIY